MSAPSQTPRRQDSFAPESPLSPGAISPSPRSSRFSFAQHDVSRYRHDRRESTSSIASSIGGVLDTAPQSGLASVNELTQNSISTLLTSPITRTGLISQSTSNTQRAPSSRDIPPVTLTPIPHVKASAFSSYLSTVGELYETFQRAKAIAGEGSDQLFQTRQEGIQRPPFARRGTSDSGPASPTDSLRTLSPPPSPVVRRKSGGKPRRDPNATTPLSTIPNVYFEENFELENPRIFDVVSEKSDVLPRVPLSGEAGSNGTIKHQPAPGRKALHTNAILQEKLSWYMDTVEVHLIASIASASTSFFAALGSLKELHSEATDSVESIKTLRAMLKRLNEEMVHGGQEVVKLKRKRQNIAKLESAVDQLCLAIEKAHECETLLDSQELDKASESIDELEALVNGQPSPHTSQTAQQPPRIDLRQLKALEGISGGIVQLRSQVGRGFEGKFIDALLVDLRQHVESVPPKETLQRWAATSIRTRGDQTRAKAGQPAYLKNNESLRPALVTALAGLSSSGLASRAATAYREAIMREIKSLIRRRLPSSSDDDVDSVTSTSTRSARRLTQQEKSAILARNLRALDGADAEALLIAVYTSVGEALRRLGQQVKVLLDVTISMDPPGQSQPGTRRPSSAIRDEVTQALDLSSLLGQAVDVVQNQITKVLKVRAEQNTHLPSAQFLRFFTLNRLFADECEQVSSRAGESLKDVVNSQVREFIQVAADAEKQTIANKLDADRWDAKEFSSADDAVLQRILEGMTRTPTNWTEFTKLWEEEVPQQVPSNTHTNGDADKTSTSTIISPLIDEQKFVLVDSALEALRGIERFSVLIVGIPFQTADITTRLLDYLKLFNSRSCQLVLGAGATRSAGLKNITTKNLALASQACSFLIALIPYIREFVRRAAPGAAGPVLPEFDKVKRAVQDHQGSIHDKLVEIMASRSNAHVNAFRKIDWDNMGAEQQRAAASPSVEALAKETGTLHKVLARHVGAMDLLMIMTPIFAQYGREWTRAVRDVGVVSEGGKAK